MRYQRVTCGTASPHPASFSHGSSPKTQCPSAFRWGSGKDRASDAPLCATRIKYWIWDLTLFGNIVEIQFSGHRKLSVEAQWILVICFRWHDLPFRMLFELQIHWPSVLLSPSICTYIQYTMTQMKCRLKKGCSRLETWISRGFHGQNRPIQKT